MAILSPRRRLKRVDFPTFGLPRIEMKPDLKQAAISKIRIDELRLSAISPTSFNRSGLRGE
jgi:hypothetical protein